MKKIVCLCISTVILITNLCFPVLGLSKKQQAVKDLISLYEVEKENSVQIYAKISLEYLDTPRGILTATNAALEKALDLKEIFTFLSNPFSYHKEEMSKIDARCRDKALDLILLAISNSKENAYESDLGCSDTVKYLVKFADVYKAVKMSSDTKDAISYKKETVAAIFDSLGKVFPDMVKSGQIDKLKEIYCKSDYISLCKDLIDFTELLEKLCISIIMYKTNTDVVQQYCDRLGSNSLAGEYLNDIIDNANKDFITYFSDKYLLEKLNDVAFDGILEYVSYGNVYMDYAKNFLKALDAIRVVTLEIVFKSASYEDMMVFLEMHGFRNVFVGALFNDDRINSLKSSLKEEQGVQFGKDFYVLVCLSEQLLESAKCIAEYNKTYNLSYINKQLNACKKAKEKIDKYLGILAEGGGENVTIESKPVPGSMSSSSSKTTYTTEESVIINWTSASNATEYGLTVVRDSDDKTVFDGRVKGNSKNIGKLSAGTYRFNMRAYNSAGKGPISTLKRFTVKQSQPAVVVPPSEGNWSDWSTTPVTASSTREVQTKTQYGYYHYVLGLSGGHGAYPVDKTFFNECKIGTAKSEDYHEYWSDTKLSKKNALTYYSYTRGERRNFDAFPNKCCSDTYNFGSRANYLYYLGERTVYRYKDIHTHSYSVGNDKSHPHKEYKKCSCGDKYYTGNTTKVSGCEECYPHEHRYSTGYNNAHPHEQYKKCSTCGEVVYTGNTQKVSGCEECYPHEHSYYTGNDKSHPHKEYKKCSDCGDKYYTGSTKKVSDCKECYPVPTNAYIITYNANGGTGAPASQYKEPGEALSISAKEPTRSGYVFAGWTTDTVKIGNGYVEPGSKYTTDANLDLYAIWLKNSRTYYVSDNGYGDGLTSGSPLNSYYAAMYALRNVGGKVIVTDYVTARRINTQYRQFSGTPITVTGQTSNSKLLFEKDFGYVLFDAVTFKNIMLVDSDGKFPNLNSMGSLVLDPGANSDFTGMVHIGNVGFYDSRPDRSIKSDSVVMNSGKIKTLCVGGAYFAYSDYLVENDVTFTLNGGTVTALSVSADAYSTSHKGLNIGGNLNVIINGGNVNAINYNDERKPKISGSLNFVFNNGTKAPSTFKYPADSAQSGTYIVYSAKGGTVMPTSKPGVFDVKADNGKVAVINGKQVFDGKANFSAGITNVKWEKSNQSEPQENVTKTYSITYNANGGEKAPASQTKNAGENIKLRNIVPYKQGYVFTGWAESLYGNAKYYPNDTYSADKNLTLYAVWKVYKVDTISVQTSVTIPTFKVTLSGRTINNTYRQYPLIVYNDITYFPMTYYDSRLMGLETGYSQAEGLSIWQTSGNFSYQETNSSTANSGTYTATVAQGPIYVNGKFIDNGNEEYPLLLFRDVTYFPLTWRFAVQEFGWSYYFDMTNGLVISK